MPIEKQVMSGNAAIARGFYEAGGKVAASYPGSPTVELLEHVREFPEIYAEFSTNEKVALEVAIGSSMGGVRSMVSMKHVGVNIAMDPLMTFTQTHLNGGFLLVTGDDPGMASSQNEQDNRILGKFANMAILDPSNSQEAKDYTKLAFELSEEYNLPMMLRITSRLCHSRSVVELEERKEVPSNKFEEDPAKYCMLPPYTFKAQFNMQERIEKLSKWANEANVNKLNHVSDDVLIITSGLAYENLMEVTDKLSVLKLGMVYPLPMDKIKELSKKYARIVIIEEMMPFIENELKIEGISCEGKKWFSFTGELNIDVIEKGLKDAGLINETKYEVAKVEETISRGPLFCSGCPHRPVFDILKKAKALVVGDIGCYSMGILYPFEVLKTNISMGASLGMIKGMRLAMDKIGDERPVVGVIGDGTFFHSGLTGFANLRYQLKGDENITMLVLDNGTTAMTGGQPTASSKHRDNVGQDISIDELLKTMGYDDIQRIDQFDYPKAKEVINAAIKRPGISIVITSRPCALKFKIKEPHFYVDPNICIGCKTCIKTNCPPLRMKKYEGIEKLKSSIDKNQCVGCSICAQVCPVNAIKRSEVEQGGSHEK
ncbi:indolepyruvate ferredoxin oxidoreductase alpha subunit [Acetoanaerobium noterae]|uniref:Indolepyruvate oxidoreductase subunit IorA n=1 Tax=Acetoanaerobium noterae TaxID=745369 RepID=A0A1T5A3A4_9FIRM|nr:thiamine pyrophosphate-dependent enzyme [Acetoanaerobium noterae]MDK2803028.1 indolepyruvate ferredoxin oxidoreductase, alpha subunit [Peptostreptococcaceae bacterium]SKB29269.1 indolepyruvate ferredoxin oxidoreductase alpha subunit [Acetoanaerobium noterae]